jgi:hypothetical protein
MDLVRVGKVEGGEVRVRSSSTAEGQTTKVAWSRRGEKFGPLVTSRY